MFFLPSWLWLSFVSFLFFIFLQFSCGPLHPFPRSIRAVSFSFYFTLFSHCFGCFPSHPHSNSQFIRFIYFLPYLCVSAVLSSSSSSSALSVLAFVLSCGKWMMLCHPIDDYMKSGKLLLNVLYIFGLRFFTMSSRTHYYVCALCVHSFYCQLLFIYLIANAFSL